MKQTQILAELAASNTTKTLQPVYIIPAEPESAEAQLGLTHEEALLLAEELPGFNEAAITEIFTNQPPESASLDEELAASNSRVAVIPVVDREVDAPIVRGPIDIQVGTSRIRNPDVG